MIYQDKDKKTKTNVDNKFTGISKIFIQDAEQNIIELDELDIDKFNSMVDLLISKKRVFIIGSQILEVTTVFATYSLGKVSP